jgi:hypothetical protein
MRASTRILAVAALSAAAILPGWAQQSQPSPPASQDQVLDRMNHQEMQEVASLRKYSPLVEIYIQDMTPDRQMGRVPESDEYYLGKGDLRNGVQFRSMVSKQGTRHHIFDSLKGIFSASYEPDGFLRMIYLDTNGLDRGHYDFQYIRREFLGEVRCLVFDVVPKKNAGKGRFKGRIWVEDKDYNIVRFNGVFVPNTFMGWYFHFDSWRVNTGPGLWLPAYVYSEESDLKDLFGHVRFKAQVRLWGYNLSPTARQEELGRMLVEAPTPVQDQSEAARDSSPVQSERSFEREAEENVLDRLELAGLLAPKGEVDKVLDTVVNNLEVSNSLDIEPEIHCRVLLTSTLESFTVGHTIILSRGLLDVLPDEPSLATMLAQELSNVVLGHNLDTKYAFNDRMLFPDLETLHSLSFHLDPKDDAAASQKAVDLLKNSPYKNQLSNAGLFLKALDARARSLPHLISPRLGNRVPEIQALVANSPKLEITKTDQIAALPLGSRIKLDPWNDHIEMVKSKPVTLLSAREKMPFEVTPFMPYLVREGNPSLSEAARADTNKSDPPK